MQGTPPAIENGIERAGGSKADRPPDPLEIFRHLRIPRAQGAAARPQHGAAMLAQRPRQPCLVPAGA